MACLQSLLTACVYTFSILTHKLLPSCLHFSLFTPPLCLYFAPFWHTSFSPGVCLQSHHQPLCGRVWDRNRDQPWRGEDQIRIETLETEEQKRGNHYTVKRNVRNDTKNKTSQYCRLAMRWNWIHHNLAINIEYIHTLSVNVDNFFIWFFLFLFSV